MQALNGQFFPHPRNMAQFTTDPTPQGVRIPIIEFSCYANPAIRNALRAQVERRQICLLGVETHICVLQTALDLQANGWDVVVAIDATASRDPQQSEWGLNRLRQAGIILSSTESIFYEWMNDAADPRFRQLAPAWR